ncbi:hypothetical protein YC2023_011347 [Brassica napus]
MSYWNAYQENPDQILFLKYETIRADTLPYVKRLAEFMGYGFTAEEEKKGVVEEPTKERKIERVPKEEKTFLLIFIQKAIFQKGKGWRLEQLLDSGNGSSNRRINGREIQGNRFART